MLWHCDDDITHWFSFLQGISVYADPLKQRLKEFLDYVSGHGLKLFTWGDVNTEAAFHAFQQDIGISGIIYDRYLRTIYILKKLVLQTHKNRW